MRIFGNTMPQKSVGFENHSLYHRESTNHLNHRHQNDLATKDRRLSEKRHSRCKTLRKNFSPFPFGRNDRTLVRILLSTLLVFFALWMATSGVIPASVPETSQPHVQVIWRRTNSGWIRAENWLVKRDYLYQEPEPPVYPLAVLPMVILLSLTALVVCQPVPPCESPTPLRQDHR